MCSKHDDWKNLFANASKDFVSRKPIFKSRFPEQVMHCSPLPHLCKMPDGWKHGLGNHNVEIHRKQMKTEHLTKNHSEFDADKECSRQNPLGSKQEQQERLWKQIVLHAQSLLCKGLVAACLLVGLVHLDRQCKGREQNSKTQSSASMTRFLECCWSLQKTIELCGAPTTLWFQILHLLHSCSRKFFAASLLIKAGQNLWKQCFIAGMNVDANNCAASKRHFMGSKHFSPDLGLCFFRVEIKSVWQMMQCATGQSRR